MWSAVTAANPDTRVLDTRKTTPGLRALEKAAVRAGGGHNHRGSLSDAVLVKDNHLGGLTIAEAVARARHLWPGRMVEVECDRIEQVGRGHGAGAMVVMLDNMDPDGWRRASPRCGTAGAGTLVEVSGGVDLDTAADVGGSRRRPRLGGSPDPLRPGARPGIRSAAGTGGGRG